MPDSNARRLAVLPSTGAAGKIEELKRQPIPSRSDDPADPTPHTTASPEQQPLVELVIGQIQQVYDPEIPVNLYDLGLIYKIDIDAENRVKIDMTLTAPGCPVAGELPLAVERKVEELDDVRSAEVELVWEPAWDKGRMSEVARLELGM